MDVQDVARVISRAISGESNADVISSINADDNNSHEITFETGNGERFQVTIIQIV